MSLGICLHAITTTASRHFLLALVVTEVLCFVILILGEKEGEREYDEDDDIVIRMIWHQYSTRILE
jgi:hypothetical protein